jgi:tetratricopeptide (TPR) repeat protein
VNELLKRFPTSELLLEEAGRPSLQHLAADPYRVIRIASQYAGLGLYQKALEILSRDYPPVAPDQTEPGTTPPQKNPLVLYLSGYYREKFGAPGASDYARASQLPTLYVFPSTPEEKLALEAALRSNPADATAHSLLGTWYFARSKTPEALREWKAAQQLGAHTPALEASLGLALLHEIHDFPGAFDAFNKGITNDPKNIENYFGAVAAMTLLGASAPDRVKTLERYPNSKEMPNPLVYELALNRAESGDYEGAVALFQNRFFGREEGGTNVRQVWIEVRLQQAAGLAKAGDCQTALTVADRLGAPVPKLDFTADGLTPFLESARTDYTLGEIYATCGKREQAAAHFVQAAKASGTSETLWAWAASKKLGNYDEKAWRDRLSAAASRAEKQLSSASNRQSWSLYMSGVLNVAAGNATEGNERLRKVFLFPDSGLAHHLARLALAGATPR